MSGYAPVTEEQIANWSVGAPNAFAAITGHNETRLSLAGAQDKLPVHVDGDQILVPLGSTPSTHILKFASPHESQLPENETFITLLTKRVGLPVVDVRVRKTAGASVTLIARYDRQFESGHWRRLHQEDFCQALGIHASRKYEKEGGPSFKQCAEIVRRHLAFPLVDLQKLMRWSLFNLFVGNADAHGKNLVHPGFSWNCQAWRLRPPAFAIAAGKVGLEHEPARRSPAADAFLKGISHLFLPSSEPAVGRSPVAGDRWVVQMKGRAAFVGGAQGRAFGPVTVTVHSPD